MKITEKQLKDILKKAAINLYKKEGVQLGFTFGYGGSDLQDSTLLEDSAFDVRLKQYSKALLKALKVELKK